MVGDDVQQRFTVKIDVCDYVTCVLTSWLLAHTLCLVSLTYRLTEKKQFVILEGGLCSLL